MLCTVRTVLERRRPAIRLGAVTSATVRNAGLPHADHLVGAALEKAFACTAAVFATQSLADRGGGASRHGARLVVTTAVFEAIL